MKKINSFLIVLSFVVTFFINAPAQTRGKQSPKGSKVAIAVNRNQKKPVVSPTPTPETKNLTADKLPIEDYDYSAKVKLPKESLADLSIMKDTEGGNVLINVSSNDNFVYRVGLAERGVAIIDFPSDDPVYRIHPGDEDFVTVGCTSRDQNGKCGNSPTDAIILRPGKNFHSLGSEESAATIISVQRVSGLVLTFIVVPVKSIGQNDNYIAVRYKLSDIIEARKKAGLAVNLQPGVILPATNQTSSEKNPEVKNPGNNPDFLKVSDTPDGSSENSKTKEDNPLETSVVAELQRVAQSSGSGLRFSKPTYGLSLALASSGSRTGDVTIDVVAVRNTLPQAIRLLNDPQQPELVIENKDKRDSVVNVQRVSILHTATTVEADNILQPGQIYYFAFAYNSPILGVKQVLRVNFKQREAADAPASIELGSLAR